MNRGRFSLVLVAVLVAGACYEVAVALKWISIGREPDQGASGEGIVRGVAAVAMLAAFVYSATVGMRGRSAAWTDALLPLAGAGFTAARFFSFDPYYAPSLRRFSESGMVRGAWIAGLLVGAGTMLFEGAGH